MNLTESPKTIGEVMKASREQLEHWRRRGPATSSKAEKRVYDRIAARLAKLKEGGRA
jgi:hypothetical protein